MFMRIQDLTARPNPADIPRVLSRTAARQLGFSDAAIEHRLATRRWQLILPHTLLTSDTITWNDRLVAAVIFAGEGALLSGAAALGDLDLRSVRRPDTLLVLVPEGRQPRSTEWVHVRPSPRPVTAARAPGVPRASVARAVADTCVGRRHLDDVRALVADAVRRGLCTIDELASEVRHGPMRGSKFLRQAVDEVGGGAWSAPEARAATLMRDAGLPAFEQNARIELPDGRWFVADFLWRSRRAILEIDSDSHHSLAGDADRTSDRHLLLETLGYSTVHRTPRLIVNQPTAFVRGIARWLDARSYLVLAS